LSPTIDKGVAMSRPDVRTFWPGTQWAYTPRENRSPRRSDPDPRDDEDIESLLEALGDGGLTTRFPGEDAIPQRPANLNLEPKKEFKRRTPTTTK